LLIPPLKLLLQKTLALQLFHPETPQIVSEAVQNISADDRKKCAALPFRLTGQSTINFQMRPLGLDYA